MSKSTNRGARRRNQLLRQKIAELEQKVRRLEGLTFTDALTGTGNRRAFDRALTIAVAASRRGAGSPLSLAVVDIDHFKSINDTYGHDGGDSVLRSVGSELMRTVRASDQVFRLGGEEFVILLPGTDLAGAQSFFERLRHDVANTVTRVGVSRVQVTASFGVATLSPIESGGELLKRADEALYVAKRSGRNQVQVA